MQSESARMSSAAEARFRIDAPNSKPRAVKVIALDQPSERVVKELAQRPWNSASFFTASAFGGAPRQGESFAGWLIDLAGRTKNLVSTDNGIIMARHRLLRALKAMEKGETPPGISHEHQRVRSAAVVLPPDKHFKDAAKEALVVQTGKEHVTV